MPSTSLTKQSIIDLLIPGQSPGIKGPIVDMSGRKDPEILFFGPDENSADLMDWAAEHARARNAPWWKSFTTGKSAAKLGGIPHDICELAFPSDKELADVSRRNDLIIC